MFSKTLKKSLNHFATRSKRIEIMDGNSAASYISYGLSDSVFMFPITPATPIVEKITENSNDGMLNIFGNPTTFSQMQSELGVAAALHGALQGGLLSSTATTSQGLLLMLPSIYKIVGEGLPCVIHVPCRSIGNSYQSLYPDHSDVMSMRTSGIAMLVSGSVQEVHDMSVVSHLAALEAGYPFIHFFDGFRTSHEFSKIEVLDYEELSRMIDYEALQKFQDEALNPEDPHGIGGGQFQDMSFLLLESENKTINNIPIVVENLFEKFHEETGRQYRLFDYFGNENAEHVIVVMASGAETAIETVEYLYGKYGDEIGVVVPRLYRPFSGKHFIEALPKTVKKISALDRVKEKGSSGDPLYLDVITSVVEAGLQVEVLSGRFGIAGKEFTPEMVESVLQNMEEDKPKNHFIVGVTDDVYHTNLDAVENSKVDMKEISEGVHECMFWGLGGDGTIGANQQAVEILGMKTDLNAQVYFAFDGKKTGGNTITHMRLSKKDNIRSEYLIRKADYLACHVSSYIEKYNIPKYANKGGLLVLNCPWGTVEELEERLPKKWRNQIAKKDLKFYVIDAQRIASGVGLGGRINMIMQTVFFALSDILPIDEAIELLKISIQDEFSKKGEKIVAMNIKAVDQTLSNLIEVEYDKEKWSNSESESAKMSVERYIYKPRKNSTPEERERMERVMNVIRKSQSLEGDSLKLSDLSDFERARFPMDTSRYEKRGITLEYPHWDSEKCIGCNMCAFVCPHAAVRPYLLTDEDVEDLHQFDSEECEFEVRAEPTKKKLQKYQYRVQVSPYDCTGCSCCISACPTNALEMKSVNQFPLARDSQAGYWEYLVEKTLNDIDFWQRGYDKEKYKMFTIQGSQFRFPYLQFPDSCAGCAQTAYVKLLTQLYGDRMVLSNATGCSLVAMGLGPSYPLQKDAHGEGPAYANSLFEDGAEFGYGMFVGNRRRRDQMKKKIENFLETKQPNVELSSLLSIWVTNYNDGNLSKKLAPIIKEQLIKLSEEELQDENIQFMVKNDHLFLKLSNWLVGGDGWAYDIDFGGLIHTLQSGEDFNIFVLDNQLYSNTGGQMSKASPLGGITKLCPSGKDTAQMDLGKIVMGLGSAYVASVAMGADSHQLIKAIKEAEEYDGPSLIIGYCPCIGHGHTTGGLGQNTLHAQKVSVASGFWPLYRYNPEKGFSLDSKNIDVERLEELFEKEMRFKRVKSSEDGSKELLGKLKEYVSAKNQYLNWFDRSDGDDMIFSEK